MFVSRAAVVGAGTMGGEIAQVVAAAGVPVLLKDVDQRAVDQGLAKAEEVTRGQLSALAEKGRLTRAEADVRVTEILGAITGTTSYDGFGQVDLVVEAVPERMELKQAVFAELDEVTPGHAVLASNTSALSITEMAEVTLRPEQVLGFHFFWPASVMRLVEIVEGDATSPETISAAIAFAQRIRKAPITCAEVPGFVVNRILNSAMSEVWRAQEEEELDTKAVDRAVQESKVAPMGPYFLTDLLGLDTVLHVAQHLEAAYGDRFYVHSGMRDLVAAGDLGRKTGKGFYDHGD
jgi:3-hydroxyacyl-CoA dehydrogenase